MNKQKQSHDLALQKRTLFSHADPTLAIKQMKTITSHLHSTRDLLHHSLDQLSNIKLGISNTSSNLIGTSQMYDQYDQKTKKSSLYIHQLKKREQANSRRIRMAFWFLIGTAIYIIIRRIIFPDSYRWR